MGEKRVRAIRGACCAAANSDTAILDATRELLTAIVAANRLEPSDVISAILSATPDLNAAFPAQAARELGWQAVPLFCCQEMAVPGALARTIRVLIHIYSEGEVEHVYLGEARALRPDLAKKE